MKKQLKYIALFLFLTGLVFIVFLKVISGQSINKLMLSNQNLLDELKIQDDLRKLQVDILTIESDIRGGVITQDKTLLRNAQSKMNTIGAEVTTLNSLLATKHTAKDIEELNYLIQEKNKFNVIILETFNIKGKGAAETIINTNRGQQLRDSLASIINRLDNIRGDKLQRIITSIQESGTQARILGFALAFIACLFLALAFWYIVNQGRQQVRMIAALNRSERRIKEASRTKEQFLANMSHEIRTPMNAILGFTNLMQRTPLDPDQKHYMEFIQSSCENLLGLINDILDLSKIEAGMMQTEEAPFTLSGLLNSVEMMFHEKAAQKGLQLNFSLQQDIPDALQGDATKLTQILINLLSNAIKFTKEGGVSVKVTAPQQTSDEVVLQFKVKDTGIGIPAGKQQAIFERFKQAEADTTRRYGGTGLGLSIVLQLIELQKGSIHVESREGEGAEFTVILPYKIAATNNIATDKYADLLFANLSGAKILIAEDNPINQQLINHLMKHWQLDYQLVQTGNEVIVALQREKYSLVLMDIQMPEMDGYTATLKVRNELKSPVPIIAMTAHAMTGEKEKCLSYGMNDYISKPIKEAELYQLIQKYTGHMVVQAPARGVVDLAYLKDLSKGDTEFEQAIIQQFILQVPEELELLQQAIEQKNLSKIKTLAHGMKSSVGYMGLNHLLQQPLQRIESEAVNATEPFHFQEDFHHVKEVCYLAIQEVKKLPGNTVA